MPTVTTIHPPHAIWFIPEAQLFDPRQFLASVSPAKPDADFELLLARQTEYLRALRIRAAIEKAADLERQGEIYRRNEANLAAYVKRVRAYQVRERVKADVERQAFWPAGAR